jgi:hypothetical protein
VSRSLDGGDTWTDPIVPHRDGTKSEHGFVSFAPWAAGEMGIVWLDGRHTAARGGHESHGAGPSAAAMALMFTTIGRDGRLGPETSLDARVCDCCQTDMARAGDATVVVYRDRVRDISVARYAGGAWSRPASLARDGWKIDGCPVNGPAIAASGADAAAAWFTAAHDEPRVKLAFSRDAGATFGAPVVVDDGRPLGRVDVVLVDGGAIVSWLEQVAGGAALRVRRVAADGAHRDSFTVADSSAARSSGFPRMVESGGEVTIAWRDPSDPARVRTKVLVF